MPPTTALRTDRYELTMLDAARGSGVAGHRAVFEVFARALPAGRRYGVVCGTGRLADAVARFQFDDRVLAQLAAARVAGDETIASLADFRFRGDIVGYAEGDTYFPDSPVVRVEGTFGESVLLETLVLSILNHDAAIRERGGANLGRRRPPPARRDGWAPHARRRGGGRGTRGIRRRVPRDVESRSGPTLRHPDHGHRRARVRARACR